MATSHPDQIHVFLYSVLIKRSAVVERLPGGIAEFERTQWGESSNDDLYVVRSMSWPDVEHTLQKLHEAGLVAGEDFGAMVGGEGVLVPCHGIRSVYRESQWGMEDELFAQFDESYRYDLGEAVTKWEPLEPPEPAPGDQVVRWRRSTGPGLVHWVYIGPEGGEEEEA